MTDRQIRCFIALYDTLNFSAAAHRLFLTQPTLSYQIRTLEEDLGVPLFVRTTSRVEVTDAGRQFAQFAFETRRLYSKLQSSLQSTGSVGSIQEKLVLQAPATMVARDPLYHDLLFAFRQRLPNCELEVRSDMREQGLEQKLEKDIDALICIKHETLSKKIDIQILFNTRCFLLCGPDSTFSNRTICLGQLSGQTICYEPCDLLLVNAIRARLYDTPVQWRKVSSFEQEYPNLLAGRCLFFTPVRTPIFPKEWYRELLLDSPLAPTCLLTRHNDTRPSIKVLKELTVLEHARAIKDGRLAAIE